MTKRIFDISISTFLILIFFPIMILIILLIKLFEDFDVFFIQKRAGKSGKAIFVYKFQTIKNVNIDKIEISKIGRFLRISRLDELPQFFNVLKGEMSLVGPRPLYIKYNKLYNNHQKKRLLIKPGITGWAQVNGDNNLSWSRKFEYDVWYVENENFFLDLLILLKTIILIFKKIFLNKKKLIIEKEFDGKN